MFPFMHRIEILTIQCFIGYRSLQRTIALYKKTYPGGSKDEFQIVWKPYFIDQVAPEESVLVNGMPTYFICISIYPHLQKQTAWHDA